MAAQSRPAIATALSDRGLEPDADDPNDYCASAGDWTPAMYAMDHKLTALFRRVEARGRRGRRLSHGEWARIVASVLSRNARRRGIDDASTDWFMERRFYPYTDREPEPRRSAAARQDVLQRSF